MDADASLPARDLVTNAQQQLLKLQTGAEELLSAIMMEKGGISMLDEVQKLTSQNHAALSSLQSSMVQVEAVGLVGSLAPHNTKAWKDRAGFANARSRAQAAVQALAKRRRESHLLKSEITGVKAPRSEWSLDLKMPSASSSSTSASNSGLRLRESARVLHSVLDRLCQRHTGVFSVPGGSSNTAHGNAGIEVSLRPSNESGEEWTWSKDDPASFEGLLAVCASGGDCGVTLRVKYFNMFSVALLLKLASHETKGEVVPDIEEFSSTGEVTVERLAVFSVNEAKGGASVWSQSSHIVFQLMGNTIRRAAALLVDEGQAQDSGWTLKKLLDYLVEYKTLFSSRCEECHQLLSMDPNWNVLVPPVVRVLHDEINHTRLQNPLVDSHGGFLSSTSSMMLHDGAICSRAFHFHCWNQSKNGSLVSF